MCLYGLVQGICAFCKVFLKTKEVEELYFYIAVKTHEIANKLPQAKR